MAKKKRKGRHRQVLGAPPGTLVASPDAAQASFSIHPLALEDILYPQRPKFEFFENSLLLTLAMPYFSQARLEFEKLTLFVGDGFVLTFQEGAPGDCLEPVRVRLRESKGRIRGLGADSRLCSCGRSDG